MNPRPAAKLEIGKIRNAQHKYLTAIQMQIETHKSNDLMHGFLGNENFN